MHWLFLISSITSASYQQRRGLTLEMLLCSRKYGLSCRSGNLSHHEEFLSKLQKISLLCSTMRSAARSKDIDAGFASVRVWGRKQWPSLWPDDAGGVVRWSQIRAPPPTKFLHCTPTFWVHQHAMQYELLSTRYWWVRGLGTGGFGWMWCTSTTVGYQGTRYWKV